MPPWVHIYIYIYIYILFIEYMYILCMMILLYNFSFFMVNYDSYIHQYYVSHCNTEYFNLASFHIYIYIMHTLQRPVEIDFHECYRIRDDNEHMSHHEK